MSVLDELEKAGGCTGGVIIYYAAKEAAWAANHIPGDVRKSRKLTDAAKLRLKKFFPKLDLGKVRYSIRCTLPGNWFTSSDSVEAMTFGYHIYCKNKSLLGSYENYFKLIHELVHVDQVRHWNDSESKFACEYGKGYLKAGNYRDNPLEAAAYDFVDAIPFDPDFYLYFYDDLSQAFGSDQFKGFCHWLENGIDEGRASSRAFDVSYYFDHYPDLQAAFGTDYAAGVRHWIEYGIKEGRRASAAFDVKYYLDTYSDLQKAFGKGNFLAALKHWYDFGMSEGRQSAPDFDVKFYLSHYSDLQATFGQNYTAGIDHWLKFGVTENRQGVQKKSPFRRTDGFTIKPTKIVIPNFVHH